MENKFYGSSMDNMPVVLEIQNEKTVITKSSVMLNDLDFH